MGSPKIHSNTCLHVIGTSAIRLECWHGNPPSAQAKNWGLHSTMACLHLHALSKRRCRARLVRGQTSHMRLNWPRVWHNYSCDSEPPAARRAADANQRSSDANPKTMSPNTITSDEDCGLTMM
eukprot:4098139-Amphidinium_carterae.1